MALVGTGQNISTHMKREQGFLSACQRLGMKARPWIAEQSQNSALYGYLMTQQIIDSGEMPDGIFYSADEFAVGNPGVHGAAYPPSGNNGNYQLWSVLFQRLRYAFHQLYQFPCDQNGAGLR